MRCKADIKLVFDIDNNQLKEAMESRGITLEDIKKQFEGGLTEAIMNEMGSEFKNVIISANVTFREDI